MWCARCYTYDPDVTFYVKQPVDNEGIPWKRWREDDRLLVVCNLALNEFSITTTQILHTHDKEGTPQNVFTLCFCKQNFSISECPRA
jgi:hypothetical protein